MARKKVEFPPQTCGACDHIRKDPNADKFWCWGVPMISPLTGDVKRCFEVDAFAPKCCAFSPRMHA